MKNMVETKVQGSEALTHMVRVSTVAFAHMAHDVFGTMISTLLPVFIDKFQISNFVASIMPVFVRAPSVLQPVFGRIADRKEVRWILILWPSVTAIFMTMTGVVNNLYAVLILLLGTGISGAIFHAVAGAAAGKSAGKFIGRAMGLWMIGARVGAAISPILVVFVIERFSLRGLPILVILSLVSSVLLYTQFHQTPLYLSTTTEVVKVKDSWNIISPIVIPLLVIAFLQSYLGILYLTYLPTFLTQSGNSLWVAGISLSLFSVAGIPASYIGGSLSDKIGIKKIYLLSVVATVTLNYIFLAVQGWSGIIFAVLIGFSMALIAPIPMSIVQTSFPEMRSYANGMFVGMNFFLRSIALLVVGFLSDLFGMRILYVVFAVMYFLSLPIVLFKLPEKPEPAKAQN